MRENLFNGIRDIDADRILDLIYNEDYKLDEPEFEKIISEYNDPEFNLESFLTKEDILTDRMYDKEKDGKTIYPLFEKPNRVSEYIGNVGDQNNIFHKENLSQHSLLNKKNIDLDVLEREGIDRNLFIKAFDYNNLAKKYTMITLDEPSFEKDSKGRDIGQTGFSSDKNKLASYLLARDAKINDVLKQEIEPFVKALYHKDKVDKEIEIPIKTRGISSIFKNKEKFVELDPKVLKISKILNNSEKGIVSPEKLRIFEKNVKKFNNKKRSVNLSQNKKLEKDMRAGKFKTLEYEGERLVSKDVNKNKSNKVKSNINSNEIRKEVIVRKYELADILKNNSLGLTKNQSQLEKLDLENKIRVQNERDNDLRLKYYYQNEEFEKNVINTAVKATVLSGSMTMIGLKPPMTVMDKIKQARKRSRLNSNIKNKSKDKILSADEFIK